MLAINLLVSNKWVSGGDFTLLPLTSKSQQKLTLTLKGLPYGHYEVKTIFKPSSKDVTNISYYSSWSYFQVVK